MNENLENLKHKADQFTKHKRWDELIPVCTEIIDLTQEPSEKVLAYLQRGTAYREIGAFDQAIADFKTALRQGVQYAAKYSYYNLAVVYLQTGDFDQAIINFKEALRVNPADKEALRGLGVACSKKGTHEQALAYFNDAVEAHPDDATIYIDRGITYAEKGEYDKAIADLTTAINLDPLNAIVYHNRGLTYSKRGRTYTQSGAKADATADFDKAINDFAEAIRLDPMAALPYGGRGEAYIDKENYNLALDDFVRAEERDPNLKLTVPATYIASQIASIYRGAEQEDDKATAFKFYFKLFKATDALKTSRFFNPKAVVAHYSSLHTLKTLATKGRFRFYNAAYMNDPEEGRVFFEIMKEYAIDVQEVFYGDEAPPSPSPAYIGSFVLVDAREPKEKDKLFLWRTYGKHEEQEAAGSCLIFKHDGTVFAENCGTQIGAMQQLQVLLKLPTPTSDTSLPETGQLQKPELYRIVYGDIETNEEVSEELKQLADSLRPIRDYLSNKDAGIQDGLKQLARELLDTIRFLFKASHYSEEREVRAVQIRYYDENLMQEMDEIKVDAEQIPPRFYLETHENFRFSEVILGPKTRHIEEWLRWLKEQGHDYVKQSTIKYGTKYT